MKKTTLIISSLIISLLLGSCGSNKKEEDSTSSDKVIIRILHQEDYMDDSLIDSFMEEYPECQVVFDTSDTNETVYNALRTGKSEYNLLTVSEYMIQRLASEGLIQKMKLDEDSTYKQNVSPWLTNKEGTGKIDAIQIKDVKTGDYLGKLSEYTAGYMWGTLGTVVNPYYTTYQSRQMEKETIISDLRGIDGWSKFWDKQYKGTHSVKDSMRDTYALGIFEVYKDKFLDENISYEDKNNLYFNDHSSETLKAVKDKLIDLKGNIFGFEVDSGKNDIVTGKIGMNLAWSGDAAFSILQGEFYPGEDEEYSEEKPENKKTKLYYNIPESGSNVWFDGFAMPKTTDKNSKEYEYTLKFIDFLSRPENVVSNMSYTGYTSFISGKGNKDNEVLNFVKDSYDTPIEDRNSDMKPYDISYFFSNENEEETLIYADEDSFEGRSLVALYPEKEDLNHLYVMEDYGKDNGRIVQMWEDIKVNPLPLWVDVFLITFFVILIGYLSTYKLVKNYKVKKRKELRKKL